MYYNETFILKKVNCY